jgi:phage-related protein
MPVASHARARNKYVIIRLVDYTISYYSASVQTEILNLPDTLAARYVVLTRRMLALGPNLGEPHTKAFGDGLFELRLKGAEGIARVFYGTLVSRRIVILHSFVKKSRKTPRRELEIAERRLKEVKDGNT